MSENQKEISFKYEKIIKRTVVEFVLFSIFLISSCIVVYGNVGTSLYYCTDMFNKIFVDRQFKASNENQINFLQMTTIGDFWNYSRSILLDGIHNEWHKRRDKTMKSQRLLTENILMGGVRMRQLRVRNDSCVVHDLFLSQFTECYDYFSAYAEDRRPYGLKQGKAWNYHDSDELRGFFTWAKVQLYPGGGYLLDLSDSHEENHRNMNILEENKWVDRGTRVIFIEFTIYNPNLNVFSVSKLIIEILPTGGLVTSTSFRVLKLLKYNTTSDIITLVFEAMYVIQVIFFTGIEFVELCKNGKRYFYYYWNWIDMSIMVLSSLSVMFSIYRYFYINEKMRFYQKQPRTFNNFDLISFMQLMFLDCLGFCTFLVWVRILKFMQFNKTLINFGNTLANCAKDVFGFGFMFLIVFIAYAQLGFILFGSEIADFRSFFNAIFTLMRTILGDFDYLAIERANRILGPIYFLSYIFFVFFVLLNMFLAIINDTYSAVKSQGVQQTLPFGQFIKDRVKALLKKMDKKRRIGSVLEEVESEKIDGDDDDKIDEEIEAGTAEEGLTVQGKCMECVENKEKIDSLNERLYAVENALDHCVLRFSELVKKLQ